MSLCHFKKNNLLLAVTFIFLSSKVNANEHPIDRHGLVTRHNIEWDDVKGQIPLGNGEFCVNVDGTGLQTFGGSTLSHWAWHSAPLPDGFTIADVPATGTEDTGRITGRMRKAAQHSELDGWMFRNPHPANLGRLRLMRNPGRALKADEIRRLSRTYDLWTGRHTSRFEVDSQPVIIETCVHPTEDGVAVRANSPLLRNGQLVVVLDFPYPDVDNRLPWAGAWDRAGAHTSEWSPWPNGLGADIRRRADALTYHTTVAWSDDEAALARDTQHRFVLSADQGNCLAFVCMFSEESRDTALTVAQTQQAAALHWASFWETGGAIDLSESTDPRWRELERRIVLSQYQMAAQSAGAWPPAEIGLMGIDFWSGQFHMEMIWWHLAHYGLWDRWSMAESALDCYSRFLPVATELAGQFGYSGARWGKQVGPEGRTAPWDCSFLLHWQQPHPLFFAELEYRLKPTRATLEKWQAVVMATAAYMADFPVRDDQGLYHMAPIMPPSEQGITRDTVFDLAYWRWGLDQAQRWRERLCLAREPQWDAVRRNLAPLPVENGVFVHSAEWRDTYEKRAWEHPDPVGVLGMLPPVDTVDRDTAHRTVLKVWRTWDWQRCWGWDFPWMAMGAARVGEPEIAVEALLKEAGGKNHFDRRGVNTGGPCPYLPGNGGLLYAVAMMAAGWDGAPNRPAPGFPDNGRWVVRWEGLKQAP